jgi:NADH-quinone oxidoreductase subunit N
MINFNLLPLLPELFMAITGMGLLLVGVTRGNASAPVITWAANYALAIAMILLLGLNWQQEIVLNGMFKFDQFAGFMKILILSGLIVSLALSGRYLEQERIARFEYPVLVMFAGIGMMLMVSANNMLSLYMSLELQSLSLYVLAAFRRNALRSSEAGIKYFILGALSSGMLLFGISLVYGFTGSIDFEVIRTSLMALQDVPPGLVFGLVFILAGLAFKISAVPFHMWTPDVYQGAPTCVTALFAIVPKIAAMGLLLRLLFEPFATLSDQWQQVIWFMAAGSMIVGAFAAIAQENIKRLMAYSSIGNIGYALIGVVVATEGGVGAVILYMLIYLVMTSGVFTVILSMRRDDRALEKISDLRGLSQTRPFLAYAMAILMFSMSGIPPMAGFFGKLVIFQAAMAEHFYVLAVLGVLSSVVAAYYYIRIIKVMFFEDPGDAFDAEMSFSRRAVLLITVLFVLAFILKPSIIIATTQGAATALFAG